MECVPEAVIRHFPAFRGGRNQLAGRRIADEAFAQVAQHIGGLEAARLVVIERFRIGGQAALQSVGRAGRLVCLAAGVQAGEHQAQTQYA